MKGLAIGLPISSIGTVHYTIISDDVTPFTLISPAYHVPSGSASLLPTRQARLDIKAEQNRNGVFLNSSKCFS
jgi:hypothetical protein